MFAEHRVLDRQSFFSRNYSGSCFLKTLAHASPSLFIWVKG